MNQFGNQNQNIQFNKVKLFYMLQELIIKKNFYFWQLFINNNWFDGKNGKTYKKDDHWNRNFLTNLVDGDKVYY